MTSQALVFSTQDQIVVTRMNVEATWHLIREARAIIVLDRAEQLRLHASYGQQSQQCQHQSTRCQHQRAVLQSQRDRCAHTGSTHANPPQAGADTRAPDSPAPEAAPALPARPALF